MGAFNSNEITTSSIEKKEYDNSNQLYVNSASGKKLGFCYISKALLEQSGYALEDFVELDHTWELVTNKDKTPKLSPKGSLQLSYMTQDKAIKKSVNFHENWLNCGLWFAEASLKIADLRAAKAEGIVLSVGNNGIYGKEELTAEL